MMIKAKKNRWITVSMVIPLLLAAWWWTGGVDRVKASTSSGRNKAQALVAAYAKHVGVHDAIHQTLDENNDRSFGDFGFHYFPEKDVLQGRVYIARSHIKDKPQLAAGQRRFAANLNNPKIGGMYDRGGGYFVLDEDKEKYFLVKDYVVSTTTPSEFIKDFDNLNDLGAIWLMSWGPHAADQSYGAEPLPTQRIDREHDPYKRQ